MGKIPLLIMLILLYNKINEKTREKGIFFIFLSNFHVIRFYQAVLNELLDNMDKV